MTPFVHFGSCIATNKLCSKIPDGLSRYTNVLTFLEEILENLRNMPSIGGLSQVITRLQGCINGDSSFTLIIDDPLGLSRLQPPKGRENQLTVTKYKRKASDDIYFGLERESILERKFAHLKNLSPEAQVAQLVLQAQRIVILSGAGVSTESGVPAFRMPVGVKITWNESGDDANAQATSSANAQDGQEMESIWSRFDPTLATLAAIESQEAARIEYWKMHSELYELVYGADDPAQRKVKPNAAHVLAYELQRRGKLHKLITQNIDGLYQASGVLDPLEIHGTITTARCGKCNHPHDRRQAHESWKSTGGGVPVCKECKAPLRFGTIAFGEALPADVLLAAQQAVRECDLMIVMGTSLVVQPANKLPEIALDSGETPVILLNLGLTPLDKVVDLLFPEKCATIAQYILNHLDDRPIAPLPVYKMTLQDPPQDAFAAGVIEGASPTQLALARYMLTSRSKS